MGADENAALSQPPARHAHPPSLLTPDILAANGNAAADRSERVSRAEPQRLARGIVTFLPTPPIRERQTVEAACRREIRVQLQRQLEFGDAIIEPLLEQIDGGQRIVRPGIFAVGADRRE